MPMRAPPPGIVFSPLTLRLRLIDFSVHHRPPLLQNIPSYYLHSSVFSKLICDRVPDLFTRPPPTTAGLGRDPPGASNNFQ